MKEIKKSKVTFSEISKFPAVKRDLALLLDKNVQFAEIEKIATESERKLLRTLLCSMCTKVRICRQERSHMLSASICRMKERL